MLTVSNFASWYALMPLNTENECWIMMRASGLAFYFCWSWCTMYICSSVWNFNPSPPTPPPAFSDFCFLKFLLRFSLSIPDYYVRPLSSLRQWCQGTKARSWLWAWLTAITGQHQWVHYDSFICSESMMLLIITLPIKASMIPSLISYWSWFAFLKILSWGTGTN